MEDSWHKYVAEAFGVFAFVFVSAGAVLINGTSGGLGVLGIAIATGLVFLAMVYSTQHLSGAHLNPVVTVALWATGHIKTNVGVGYILSQLVGAVIATLFLKVIFAGAATELLLGGVKIDASLGSGVAIFVEAILTFLFVYTYFALVIHKKDGEHAGLALGAVVAFATLVGWSLTGGAMNPARVFGSALVSSQWAQHFVYWVGPLIGALLAAFVYNFGYMRRH